MQQTTAHANQLQAWRHVPCAQEALRADLRQDDGCASAEEFLVSCGTCGHWMLSNVQEKPVPWQVRDGVRFSTVRHGSRGNVVKVRRPASVAWSSGAQAEEENRVAPSAEEQLVSRNSQIKWFIVKSDLAAQAEKRATTMIREPHRSWFHSCLRGRGRADPHSQTNDSEKGLPVGCGNLCGTVAENDRDVVEADVIRLESPDVSGQNSRSGC